MLYLIEHKRRLWVVLVDAILTAAAYLVAHLIRFDAQIPSSEMAVLVRTIPTLIILRVGCFLWVGLYRGVWAYASVSDLMAILQATTGSSVVFVATLLLFGFRAFSRGILVLDWLLVIFLIGGSRLSLRLWRTAQAPRVQKDLPPVLVIGAGDAGEMVIRELLSNAKLKVRPVGLLDDDSGKKGLRIHGVPVLGAIAEVKEIAEAKGVDEVIIAIPSADRRTMRGIFDSCQQAGLRMKTVPGLGSVLSGTARVSELREIRLEDLLPREPARLDVNLTRAFFLGKRVLVTGAGGSIGSEICRQVAVCDPAELVLFERGETALFEIDTELGEVFPNLRKVPIIGDIRRVAKLEEIFFTHRPEIVLNAAAFKHVPLMEFHPEEAVLNNIVGARRLTEAALKYGTRLFLQISTDKAVNPTSVMGATKRAVERYLQSLSAEQGSTASLGSRGAGEQGSEELKRSRGAGELGQRQGEIANRKSKIENAEGIVPPVPLVANPSPVTNTVTNTNTVFCCVRFGNVLGSSGSVVPTFRRQIERGGPVTVTHPDITRYFMTIPEAVQLVLRAATLAQGGEIFVLDMGTPVKIAEMARDLISLSGFDPDRDVEIAFTGLRLGEKLLEELWYADEDVRPTEQDKLLVVRGRSTAKTPPRAADDATEGNGLLGLPGPIANRKSHIANATESAIAPGGVSTVQPDPQSAFRPSTPLRTPSLSRGTPHSAFASSHSDLLRLLDHLEGVSISGDHSDVLAALRRVVPEYRANGE